MKLEGAHILITGGSKGIGIEIARELARHRARLTLVARPSRELDAAAAELGAAAMPADLSDHAQVDDLVAKAEALNGPLDVLVNNAALSGSIGITEVSGDRLRAQLTANLLSPMDLMRQSLPRMIERRHGAIVNVSSLAGIFPQARLPGYSPAKAGIAKYTFDLQRELRKHGVGVTLLYLGMVSGTQIVEEGKKDPVVAVLAKKFEKAPKVTTHDVAKRVAKALRSDKLMHVITLPGVATPMTWLHQLPLRLVDPLFKEAFEYDATMAPPAGNPTPKRATR